MELVHNLTLHLNLSYFIIRVRLARHSPSHLV
jgi:hypothetical protein